MKFNYIIIFTCNIFRTQLDFLSYCWSENDPLYVDFLRSVDNQIITLEQKISRKGDVLAEICSYDITLGKMTRGFLSAVPVSNQITCFAFSPDQEKLFLGCLDRNICLHDLILQTTKSTIQIDIVSFFLKTKKCKDFSNLRLTYEEV